MRKVMLLAVAVTALPCLAIAADEELAGSYRLISSTRKILDTGEISNTWGKTRRASLRMGKTAACWF